MPINGSIYLRRKISYTKKKQILEDDRKRKVKVCCVCEECKVQKRKSTHSLFGSTSFPLFSGFRVSLSDLTDGGDLLLSHSEGGEADQEDQTEDDEGNLAHTSEGCSVR